MGVVKTPAEKLKEIQDMGRRFHASLVKEFGKEMFSEGGCLFLGRFYAQSQTIYFGLNPGTGGLAPGHPFEVELEKDASSNRPFNNSDKANKDIRYFGNWHRFLSAHPDLQRWFHNPITSTFLVPWRTQGERQLAALNKKTGGKLYNYSGQLVRKMIEHHDAKCLIVAAKRGLHLLNEVLGASGADGGGPWHPRQIEIPYDGPGGKCQYRQRPIPPENRITVLQIPHFAYPINARKLAVFADWLRRQLRALNLLST